MAIMTDRQFETAEARGRKVLDDHEGHAGVGRQGMQERAGGLDAAGGGADRDDGKGQVLPGGAGIAGGGLYRAACGLAASTTRRGRTFFPLRHEVSALRRATTLCAETRSRPRCLNPMSSPRIVVAGASAGGVVALQALASQLGPDFPAPLLVVQVSDREQWV